MSNEETPAVPTPVVDTPVVVPAETQTPESAEKNEEYRGKLNATNRFLEKEGYTFKEGKWHKPETPVVENKVETKPDSPQGLSREEAIAYAKGFDDAEVEKAKKIATVEGITLTEAFSNDLFTSWKSTKDTKAKNAKAQLGASKGGGSSATKTLSSQGLTAEEHRALAKAKM